MIDVRPTDRMPGIVARRYHGERVPPGGGACHWCNGRLYRRGDKWSYAIIFEDGYERGVHLSQCCGSDALNRPAAGLTFGPL